MSTEAWNWRKRLLEPQDFRFVLRSLVETSGLKPRIVRKKPLYAIGLVVAEDVRAEKERPEHSVSRVDGFAVRSEDTVRAGRESPVRLKLVREVDPRNASSYKLKRGEAVQVDTGFPIPEGADACVPVEKTIVEENSIIVSEPVRPGENIIARGSDFRKGSTILFKGEIVREVHTRALLDTGVEELLVYEPPRVLLHPVGDELVDPWELHDGAAGVPETSRLLLAGLLSPIPARIEFGDILPDDPPTIMSAIEEALDKGVDIIVTISGTSIGRKDHTWLTLREKLKPKYAYRGVRGMEGKTNSGMALDGTLVINLPGFTQSMLSGAILILSQILSYMNGFGLRICFPCESLIAENTVELGSPELYRVRFVEKTGSGTGKVFPRPLAPHAVYELTRSDGFIIAEPGRTHVRKGDAIIVYGAGKGKKLCCTATL